MIDDDGSDGSDCETPTATANCYYINYLLLNKMIRKLILHFLQPVNGISKFLYLSVNATLMLFGFSALLS